MARIDHEVERFAKICARNSMGGANPIRYFVDGTNVAGEGEVKIFQYLSSLCDTSKGSSDGFLKDSVLIVGGDSDLIINAFVRTQIPNLYIETDKKILLMRGIREKFVNDYLNSEVPNADERVLYYSRMSLDFAMLAFFQGNDYYPSLLGCGLTKIYTAYKVAREKISDTDKNSKNQTIRFLVDAE
eukprot:CAMPEP_0182446118 /NCGR_PEP_ID=MMETSP1172-20130603/4001_1 /TAXON_ID=708627 /ORGANISM="Timspurckia oligopyrenoides, Strain CCMP3278" /LENGTH=185 /DNA_ID=CAMNT_0024641999 /DNA_START=367 /DNA_END=921 /DNA_ORIENTATION=+